MHPVRFVPIDDTYLGVEYSDGTIKNAGVTVDGENFSILIASNEPDVLADIVNCETAPTFNDISVTQGSIVLLSMEWLSCRYESTELYGMCRVNVDGYHLLIDEVGGHPGITQISLSGTLTPDE